MGIDDYITIIGDKEKEINERLEKEKSYGENLIATATEEWKRKIKELEAKRTNLLKQAEEEANKEVSLELMNLQRLFKEEVERIEEKSRKAIRKAIEIIIEEAKRWA